MKKLNEFIADKLSNVMSTMWLFWILFIACLTAYIVQPPAGAQAQILFWVSIMFQGIALPVLAFVSNKQGNRMQSTLQETHDLAMEEMKLIHDENSELYAIVEELHQKHDELHKRHAKLLNTLEQAVNPRVNL